MARGIALSLLVFVFALACQADEKTPAVSVTHQSPVPTGKPAITSLPSSTPAVPNATPYPYEAYGFPRDRIPSLIYFLFQRVNIREDEVRVKSAERVAWRDECLGLASPGLCERPANETPGFRLVLVAAGVDYLYHTNAEGFGMFAGTPNGLDEVLADARKDVYELTGQDPNIDEIQEVIWSSTCLEIPGPEQLCGFPQFAEEAGYRVYASSASQQFCFHSARMGLAHLVDNEHC